MAGGPHGPLPARGGWGKLQHSPGDAPALPPHIKADFHARFDFSPDLPVNYLLIVIAAEDIYIMEQLSTSGSAGTVTAIITIPLAVAPARCRCAPAPNIAHGSPLASSSSTDPASPRSGSRRSR